MSADASGAKRRPGRMPLGYYLAAAFLLIFPAATMAVRGGANALLLAGTALSLVWAVWSLGTRAKSSVRVDADAAASERRWLLYVGLALCAPLLATFASEVRYDKFVFNLLDAPSRFVAAVPLLLALRRLPARVLAASDLSFALGAFASLGVIVFAPHDWGDGRLGSRFLDPIHFGDVALVLGLMSALSLHWWRSDSKAARAFKFAGLGAGLLASVMTGSRGAWLALPLLILLLVVLRRRSGKSLLQWLWLPLAGIVLAAGAYWGSAGVRERVASVAGDLVLYRQGNLDTSIGIRLQLYRAAAREIPEHPVFGLGPNGFAESMTPLVAQGAVTPVAAQFGRGETHNQMLAYTANYGLLGALAGIALYLVPAMLFWRSRAAADPGVRKAARLGLVFVLGFVVFGCTVETFDLKMIASFYAGVIAILAACVACPAVPAAPAGVPRA